MAQEIELKFIVSPHSVAEIKRCLNDWAPEHHPACTLTNIYFETEDSQLRRQDMGLRIRGRDDRYEMTMKTAGRVVGGLHQRPEYNVDLEKPELDLARFPQDIWPAEWDIVTLQARLTPLFTTHFQRETWIVTEGTSRIECALDVGEISAQGLAEPLFELELELLEGEPEALFILARRLLELEGLRMGLLSKAARGYHLAQGAPVREIKPLGTLPLVSKSTVEQAMEAALQQGLNSWLYHEELWARGQLAAKNHIVAAIGSIRAALALFGSMITRKASSELREGLMRCEALLQEAQESEPLLSSSQFGLVRLSLTRWLVEKAWRNYQDDKGAAKLAGSFKRFSDTQLSRHVAELKSVFQRPLGEGHADKLARLTKEIDTLQILASSYPNGQSQVWLENWQGLQHAIQTGSMSEIEHYRNEAISQKPFWLHSGK